MKAIGFHLFAEFYGCDARLLSKLERVKPIVEKAVARSGLTKISSKFHQFNPHGVTGIVLLSESHLSVHTWPEHGYAAVDVYTCGPPDQARKAHELLVKGFKPARVDVKERQRGELE